MNLQSEAEKYECLLLTQYGTLTMGWCCPKLTLLFTFKLIEAN